MFTVKHSTKESCFCCSVWSRIINKSNCVWTTVLFNMTRTEKPRELKVKEAKRYKTNFIKPYVQQHYVQT